MAGMAVTRDSIDFKTAQAILDLRSAFEKVRHIQQFLVNSPVVNTVDPLVGTYNYSVDDAYAIRLIFQTFNQVRTDQDSMFVIASKLTGLE